MVTDITKDMALYTEEVFGPVASMYRAADIDEAIEIANATTFGLGSNAWTNDEAEQQRFIDDIEAGQVFINGMTVSYPELGFGGVKRSGYGRELAGLGIREFCNAKTVWVGESDCGCVGRRQDGRVGARPLRGTDGGQRLASSSAKVSSSCTGE